MPYRTGLASRRPQSFVYSLILLNIIRSHGEDLEKSHLVFDSWSDSRVTNMTRVTEQESHIINVIYFWHKWFPCTCHSVHWAFTNTMATNVCAWNLVLHFLILHSQASIFTLWLCMPFKSPHILPPSDPENSPQNYFWANHRHRNYKLKILHDFFMMGL